MLAEFMQHVDATQQLWPLEGRKPTALMPPTTVVRVQVTLVDEFHVSLLDQVCLPMHILKGLGLSFQK